MNFQGRKPKWLNNKNKTQSSIRKILGIDFNPFRDQSHLNGVQNMKRKQKWIYTKSLNGPHGNFTFG